MHSHSTRSIDEPELHLNRSIRASLYTEIEAVRTDCTFIYLTHDIDFATSRPEAQKIWMKSYDSERWEHEILEPVEGLPEELLITILGVRKNVVLVEGTNDSLDTDLYRQILDDNFLVIPYGGCEEIIRGVKAFKNREGNLFHNHVEVLGIVDRDRRTEKEIKTLQEDDIYVLEVAEVENLFCTREVIKLVCDEHNKDHEEVINKLFTCLKEELSTQIEERTSQEINSELKLLTSEKLKQEEQGIKKIFTYSVDYTTKYEENKKQFDKIIEDKNYDELLKFYNRKKLANRISGDCGLAKDDLSKHVIHLVTQCASFS